MKVIFLIKLCKGVLLKKIKMLSKKTLDEDNSTLVYDTKKSLAYG